MTPPDQAAFLQRLLATFRAEADEHLAAMSALAGELEATPAEGAAPIVEALFREAHSLKGAARAVNLDDVETACARLEAALAAFKRGEVAVSPERLDALRRDIEEVERLLAAGSRAPETVPAAPAPLPPEPPPGTPGAPASSAAQRPPPTPRERAVQPPSLAPAAYGGEAVRIPTTRLTALLVQSEAFVAHRFGAAHLAEELRALAASVTEHKRAWIRAVRDVGTVRRARARNGAADEARFPELDRVLEAVERDELFTRRLEERLTRLQANAEQERRALGSLVEGLHEEMREALMQPFATLLDILPRLVRDLARDSGKEASVVVDGAAIEVDRRILEAMKDPMIHLVRNAVDHGIEPPAERARRGKRPKGRIRIAVGAKDNNRLELTLADDGAGIDLAQVKSSAVALGLLAAEDAARLAPEEALNLVFASGLSTSAVLTDLSGRGLGLAIVREKVEMLGGSIAIEQPAEGGTLFRMVLPTALATFRGVLVAVRDRRFILPASKVSRVVRIPADQIRTMENREATEIEGEAVALARLADVLGLGEAPGAAPPRFLHAALVEHGRRRIAFVVDEVLGDQEVLVKGLGPQLRRVPNISGATVLEAGRLVPILNVADLFVSVLHVRPRAPASRPGPGPARPSLLVVEDSITSRTLLKNILESAGYRVATAADGVDAFTALGTEHFDLVISDVEMPRMDGFELTARIRRDERFADLPVVLVTALESREHRERGVEAGANAYIAKSGFDQGRLLETIRRLI